MGFKSNMEDDTLEVNGRKIELDTTSSGHYYILLKECVVKIENVHMVAEQQSHEDKEKMVQKLHRQFAHPSAKSLKAIMRNADALDDDCESLIENISKKCEVCMRFKKTPARHVKMLEEDPKMEVEVALAWAVNAKNCMQNHCGFSPIQLVLDNHPNLPSVLSSQLQAFENAEVSDTVIRHLNALHAARRAFTKAESSERICKALKHNVRATETTFEPGDNVFYKRDDSNRWHGPGRVIRQDGKIVFIRHGSQLVRVATCRAIDTT
ncbi:hypothetical protein HOLleu_20462 [Holothuria leucospilota]|uniref:Uncharacterized protein n=1 Tax=Holothuria leucospilota TaxID=206669 RepID=A0A9Q1C1K6_HOLLE|nr:hypothetical protein HOLleu_20462 [Holothuria leucospilota]